WSICPDERGDGVDVVSSNLLDLLMHLGVRYFEKLRDEIFLGHAPIADGKQGAWFRERETIAIVIHYPVQGVRLDKHLKGILPQIIVSESSSKKGIAFAQIDFFGNSLVSTHQESICRIAQKETQRRGLERVPFENKLVLGCISADTLLIKYND